VIAVARHIARVFGALGLIAVAVAFAAGEGGAPATCTRGITTVEIDPRGLLALTANPIGPAATAALRFAGAAGRPQVVSADLATVDRERGGEARYECGTRVWRRTVVVYVTLRAFTNSASLSEKVFFVGRFKTGYRVWQVVH
jgi:hypothetical protein